MEILVGLWFWVAIFAVSALIIWGVEADNGAGTTAAALAGGALLWYFTGAVPLLWYLRDHWTTILVCILGYIVLGACWGVAKWWFFLHNKGDEYEAQRASFQKAWNDATEQFKTSYKNDYKEWIASSKGYPPTFLHHKADFTFWMAWWPFSMFWTLINDPLKRIYRFIVQQLSGMLTRMSNAVFAGRFTELK